MIGVVEKFLNEKGYSNINYDFYNYIKSWTEEWQDKASWLDIKTVDGKDYPMYSLGMAKRGCEDLSSIITSEPFRIKAKKNDEILQQDIKNTKILDNLPENIEKMGYSGTIATILRILNAKIVGEGQDAVLQKTEDTKIKTITVDASQIIPLTIENGEIINCAFVSEEKRKINNKLVDVYYIELHELQKRGYQISNIYLLEDGKELNIDGVLGTYNTLSQVPLFSICKLPKVNNIKNNNGLGISLYGNAEDQLKMLDLTYNNFGMDFKLGQKVMVINKKLIRYETVSRTNENGENVTEKVPIYPSELHKQQFVEIDNGLLGNGDEKPYIYEYNPDLRVGDNKAGVQFALDNYSFKLGYGTHYYSFENGGIITATEATYSRTDFVDNGVKNRKAVENYLKGVCKSILLCEKMLGANVDENTEIEIAEADGYLVNDETQREKLLSDYSAGLISKSTYLKKVYNMTDKEIKEELTKIDSEDNIELPEESIEE